MTKENNEQQFSGATNKGNREENQDAYFITNSSTNAKLGKLFIVTDGVGGNIDGDWAAQEAAKVIHHTFYAERQNDHDIISSLETAFTVANQRVYARGQERGGAISCTAVVAVVHQGQLYRAHAGDARLYLLSSEQRHLTQLTLDHAWVDEQLRAGVLTVEEAKNHNLRHVITRAVGSRPTLEVEIGAPQPLAPKDRILLCSDGLYNTLNIQEIQTILTQSPISQAADRLVAQSAPKSDDNVTAVVYEAGGGREHKDAVLRILPEAGSRNAEPYMSTVISYVSFGLILIGLLFLIFTLINGSFLGDYMGRDETDVAAVTTATVMVSLTALGQGGGVISGTPTSLDGLAPDGQTPQPNDTTAATNGGAAPTSTLLPSRTPTPINTPPPSETPTPTPTPTPAPYTGCVWNGNGRSIVWSSDAINDEICPSELSWLQNGAIVQVFPADNLTLNQSFACFDNIGFLGSQKLTRIQVINARVGNDGLQDSVQWIETSSIIPCNR